MRCNLNKVVALALCAVFASTTNAERLKRRPAITGIGFVEIHTTDPGAATRFFQKGLGLSKLNHACRESLTACFYVNELQEIEINAEQDKTPNNFIEEVGFLTADIAKMRQYLVASGLKPEKIKRSNNHFSTVSVADPAGHRITFVRRTKLMELVHGYDPQVSRHMIHAGFIVQDRPSMEHFYKDILGFRPYWQGGMKDDETSWVSLQVPDGSDWLEFMLYDPTGKDKHFHGVMNHIALGVTDIHAAQEQLRKNGAPLTEEPKIGRDGKWQLNVYDPDETRIEFMEFTPVQKPCCSEFTAPHPKP